VFWRVPKVLGSFSSLERTEEQELMHHFELRLELAEMNGQFGFRRKFVDKSPSQSVSLHGFAALSL
jgi:hypothetical protein